jgi:imidazole glycerol-phosphate synthase subunit HisF
MIPCLLLQDKGLVKTVKFKDPIYIGDPINAVRIFNESEVDELIFLDITSAKQQGIFRNKKKYSIPFDLISKISEECYMPLAYGGGIQSIEDIQGIMSTGVEKVVINSSAVENHDLIRQAADLYGNQSIIVSIDVLKNVNGSYEVMTKGGSKPTGLDPVTHATTMESCGAGEIFINSIDRDGTMNGYDIPLIKCISSSISVPLIACGGAGQISHFVDAINEGGAAAVAAGSFFVFHGKRRAVLISYPARENTKL